MRTLLAAGTVAAALLSSAVPGWSAEPAPGATVNDLLARVRKFNPELAAAALEREAAVAKIYPAGALDDPMVNLSRDQGFRQTLFTASQEFPLWGKRDLRRGVAEANAAASAGREGSATAELAEQTKVVFSQYFQADQAIRVAREIHSLHGTVADAVRGRYAQGLGSQSDAIRAELERTRLEPELSALERDEEAAKAKINALISRPAGAELAPPRELRKLPPAASLKLDALMARARTGNPMLVTARSEIEAAEGERRLVDKNWYPDVTLTLGGDALPNMGPRVTAGVGIKVPLQWGVREAQARETAAKKGAAELRLESAGLKIRPRLRRHGGQRPSAAASRSARKGQDSLLPQPDGAARHLPGTKVGLDRDGLHPRL
jgi:cobalt-zinc-cadmium efflux system outer membrane protein